MIAYRFPPEGNAGTYRSLRFVRHLSKRGWNTSVISAIPYQYERYDPELLTLVPNESEIIRVRGRDPWQAFQAKRAQKLQKKISSASVETMQQLHAGYYTPFRSRLRKTVRTIEAWYYHPDMARPWIQPALKATVEVCSHKRPNVLWATAGPVSSCIVAERAAQRTGLPYVLDFRDPYGLNYYEFEVRQPEWAKRAQRHTMYRILENAQAVVFLFDTVAECYWHVYREALDAKKIHIIPNGYEGEIDEFTVPDGDKCIILYTGTLSTYRYDTLVQSLYAFKQTDPAQAKHLHFLFVGEGMEMLAQDVKALGLSDTVEISSPASHTEILRLQREAHAFLILGREPTRKGHELVAGAKLFNYFKARRPILGVLPKDETRKTLQKVGVSTIADTDSPLEVVAVLRQVLDAWAAGKLSSLVPNRVLCEAYSAQRQTTALIRALEGLPAAEPFTPGLVAIPPSLQEEIGV
jgi:hypothetical protein